MNRDLFRNELVHLRRLFEHLDVAEEHLEGVVVAPVPGHQLQYSLLLRVVFIAVTLEDVLKVPLHDPIELRGANASLQWRERAILDSFAVVLTALVVVGFELLVG